MDARPPTAMARVLATRSPLELAHELKLVGLEVPPERYFGRVLRVECPSHQAASTLEREMRRQGGLGVWRGWSVVLCGTEAQLEALVRHLPDAGAALSEVAQAIERALAWYDRTPPGELRCGSHRLPLGERTLVMGVLNLTPDSFSGDGLGADVQAALKRAKRMVADGADLLDVGGESTRPGAEEVAEEEELARVVPAIAQISKELLVPISIDTYKAGVARAALEAGATMINDISGLRFDPGMAALAAEAGVPVVVMHIQGTPRDMQANPQYHNLLGEISDCLRQSVELAEAAGVPRDQVVVDPGIGFGKTLEHNLEILRRLRELRSLGQPVLVGTSRKSFIGKLLDLPADQRLEGTGASVAAAIANGADLVRVHDVREMARVVRISDAIFRGV